MTESRIERLLKQMPLSQPPVDLDEAVLAVIRQTPTTAEDNVSESQLEEARGMAASVGITDEDALVRRRYVSAADLRAVQGRDSSYDHVDLDDRGIPESVVELVTESTARENGVIAIGVEGDTVIVAVHKPNDFVVEDKLRFLLNRDVRFVIAPMASIQRAIDRHYVETRAAATIGGGEQKRPGDSRTSGQNDVWRLVSVVAIASLLTGVFVGRMSSSSVFAVSKQTRDIADADLTRVSDRDTDGNERNPDNPETNGDVRAEFAPQVAMLCLANTGEFEDEARMCSSCHTGVPEDVATVDPSVLLQPESPEEVRVLHRQVCARCHQLDRADENWHFPHEIDDAFKRWQPEKQEIDSPTG